MTNEKSLNESLLEWLPKRIAKELPQDRGIREDLVKLLHKLKQELEEEKSYINFLGEKYENSQF